MAPGLALAPGPVPKHRPDHAFHVHSDKNVHPGQIRTLPLREAFDKVESDYSGIAWSPFPATENARPS